MLPEQGGRLYTPSATLWYHAANGGRQDMGAMDRKQSAWPRAIIFDLDGTLVDSAPDIAESLNEVLGQRGLPPLPLASVKAMVGSGIPVLISRALEAHGVQADDVKPLVTDMIGVYAQRATRLTALFDGVEDCLGAFRRSGVKMAVCTNKQQDVTDIILRDLEISHYFECAIGACPELARKPDPAMLHHALGAMGASAAYAVMVGDSHVDAGAAKAAGMPVVLASFGYSPDPVAAFGPDAIIDSFGELPAVLRRLGADVKER